MLVETLHFFTENPEITVAALVAFGMAFSLPVRRKIWQRDGGKSVWSGETENLQVAHIDHSKTNPNYDSETNGRLLTVQEHIVDHVNREGRNGLPVHQNQWAIKRLKETAGIVEE
jgi:hypothetical protein